MFGDFDLDSTGAAVRALPYLFLCLSVSFGGEERCVGGINLLAALLVS